MTEPRFPRAPGTDSAVRFPFGPFNSGHDGTDTYEILIHSLNGIVWEADARTWRFTVVSRQAERLLGYPTQQWLDEANFWVDHLHSDDRERAIAYCLEHTARKTSHALEYRMIAADGRTVWIRDAVSVIVEDGEVVALRGVMIDVTEQKRVEEALRASELRLRQVLHASNTGLWEWDPQTGFVFLSSEYKAQLGYEPHELLDTFETWESRLHPEDRARAVAFVRRLGNGREPFRLEFRLRHRDGTYRWFEANATFIDEPPRSTRFAGSLMDITDRKNAEEALRRSEAHLASAQQMAHLGSWEIEVQNLHLVGSDEIFRIFEIAPKPAEGTYERLMAAVHPDDRARVRRAHAAAARSQSQYDLVYRLRMRDGRVKYVQECGGTPYGFDGTPRRSIGIVQDITGRMLVEQERDQLAMRLIEAREHERRAVARDLHDEIGQSLTALKLLLQQAAASRRPSPASLDAAGGIVDQILQQVRDLSLRLHPTALEELGLSWALKGHVEQEARRAGLDVDFEVEAIDEPLPDSIATACFRIAQEAFTNVIRHAAATRGLGRLRRTPEGLELLVRDNGVGVSTPTGSNSLGLAGMRERARLLGGLVVIESRQAGGTDVLMTLPLSAVPVLRQRDDASSVLS